MTKVTLPNRPDLRNLPGAHATADVLYNEHFLNEAPRGLSTTLDADGDIDYSRRGMRPYLGTEDGDRIRATGPVSIDSHTNNYFYNSGQYNFRRIYFALDDSPSGFENTTALGFTRYTYGGSTEGVGIDLSIGDNGGFRFNSDHDSIEEEFEDSIFHDRGWNYVDVALRGNASGSTVVRVAGYYGTEKRVFDDTTRDGGRNDDGGFLYMTNDGYGDDAAVNGDLWLQRVYYSIHFEHITPE